MIKDSYYIKLKKLFINHLYDPTIITKLSSTEKARVRLWKMRIRDNKVIQEGTMRLFLTKYGNIQFNITHGKRI